MTVIGRTAARGGALLLGIVLSLVLVEILLDLGAAFNSWRGDRRFAGSTGGQHRVLCVGDSNTYGLYVGAADAYPGRLQALLGDSVAVVNLGYPGNNSSSLSAYLPGLL